MRVGVCVCVYIYSISCNNFREEFQKYLLVHMHERIFTHALIHTLLHTHTLTQMKNTCTYISWALELGGIYQIAQSSLLLNEQALIILDA